MQGERAHQLMLLPHLNLPVFAPLVPLLQLGHHGLTLVPQVLLVFDQLQSGHEVSPPVMPDTCTSPCLRGQHAD